MILNNIFIYINILNNTISKYNNTNIYVKLSKDIILIYPEQYYKIIHKNQLPKYIKISFEFLRVNSKNCWRTNFLNKN